MDKRDLEHHKEMWERFYKKKVVKYEYLEKKKKGLDLYEKHI